MRRNALCLRHICRNALISPKCEEACCAVVPWDGGDHRIELQEMSPKRVVVLWFFGLSQSRTEHRLVHL